MPKYLVNSSIVGIIPLTSFSLQLFISPIKYQIIAIITSLHLFHSKYQLLYPFKPQNTNIKNQSENDLTRMSNSVHRNPKKKKSRVSENPSINIVELLILHEINNKKVAELNPSMQENVSAATTIHQNRVKTGPIREVSNAHRKIPINITHKTCINKTFRLLCDQLSSPQVPKKPTKNPSFSKGRMEVHKESKAIISVFQVNPFRLIFRRPREYHLKINLDSSTRAISGCRVKLQNPVQFSARTTSKQQEIIGENQSKKKEQSTLELSNVDRRNRKKKNKDRATLTTRIKTLKSSNNRRKY